MAVTEKQIKYLRKGVEESSWICASPFIWNKGRNSLERSQSAWRLAGFYFSTAFTIFYWTFQLWRCITLTFDPHTSVTAKFLIATITAMNLNSVFIQLGYVLHGEGIPQFHKRYLTYANAVAGELTGGTQAWQMESVVAKRGDKIIASIYTLFWTNWFQFSVAGLILPSLPHMVSSLILTEAPSGAARIGWSLLSTGIFCYFFAVFIANSVVLVGLLLPFYFSSIQILQSMRTSSCGSNRLIQAYKELQLLLAEYSELFSLLTGSAIAVLLAFACGSMYGALRFSGQLASALTVAGIGAFFVLVVFNHLWGKIRTESMHTLAAMRKMSLRSSTTLLPQSRAVDERSLRSLRPMQIRMYSCYAVEMSTVLVVARIVLDNTIFLVLNF